MKHCPDCGYKKPKSEFGNNKNSKDGKQTYCLIHYRIRRKAYSLSKNGKLSEKSRKMRFRTSGKESQYNKTYYTQHRERILSRRSVETIAEISPCSRTEKFSGSKPKVYPKTVAPRKTIVLNPRPVERRNQ